MERVLRAEVLAGESLTARALHLLRDGGLRVDRRDVRDPLREDVEQAIEGVLLLREPGVQLEPLLEHALAELVGHAARGHLEPGRDELHRDERVTLLERLLREHAEPLDVPLLQSPLCRHLLRGGRGLCRERLGLLLELPVVALGRTDLRDG